MARKERTPGAARLARAAAAAAERAKQAARTLHAEYDAGRRGDDSPPAQIWGTPKQQLDAMLAVLRGPADRPLPAVRAADGDGHGTADPQIAEADVGEVAAAIRSVDWSAVRTATAERGSEAAAAMRAMAAHVDWSKVQPVAAQVSSALIAAVASGRIGVGGPLGGAVARTIIGQAGIAEQVVQRLAQDGATIPPDFRQVIETTTREA